MGKKIDIGCFKSFYDSGWGEGMWSPPSRFLRAVVLMDADAPEPEIRLLYGDKDLLAGIRTSLDRGLYQDEARAVAAMLIAAADEAELLKQHEESNDGKI